MSPQRRSGRVTQLLGTQPGHARRSVTLDTQAAGPVVRVTDAM